MTWCILLFYLNRPIDFIAQSPSGRMVTTPLTKISNIYISLSIHVGMTWLPFYFVFTHLQGSKKNLVFYFFTKFLAMVFQSRPVSL
jgi:hypothetical protein